MYKNGKSHRMDFFGRTVLTFKWNDREYYIFLKFRMSNALRVRYNYYLCALCIRKYYVQVGLQQID